VTGKIVSVPRGVEPSPEPATSRDEPPSAAVH
jgi:hypothetical protein